MTRIGCVLKLVFIAISAVLVRALWRIMRWLATVHVRTAKEPRIVAPRSDLASCEQTTIAIYLGAKGSVVSIARPVAWSIAGPAMPTTCCAAASCRSYRTPASMG